MYNIDDIKNTVVHGDSEAELKKIPNESIDCVIIDPPYNLLKHKLDRAFNRELIYKELYRVLKNNSFLVVFGSGLQLCKDRKNCYIGVNYIKHLMIGNVENSILNVKTENYSYKHETQKPLELMSRIVKLVSNEDDIILDCFAGSGSTLLGAIKNNRNYIGIEIDKEYYDICCNRIKEKQGLFTGV